MDELSDRLRDLSQPDIEPRIYNTRGEKVELIKTIGPRTAKNIRKAKKQFKASRIPFLFSSIDARLVIDVLYNDLDEVIEEIISANTNN